MITEDGPKVVEFNARFGDPECQCILPRLDSDLLPLLVACARETLADMSAAILSAQSCLTVVMATNGYPGSYTKGDEIRGIETANASIEATVFHAGTKADGARILANGGRVLGVSAVGADINAARAHAYDAVGKIEWSGGFFRSDIGWRALK